jgi:hypothetical protein
MRTNLTSLLSGCLLLAVACGCSSVTPPAPAAASPSAADSPKQELLNNAASLLSSLLNDEKNLNKVLIIKGHSQELGVLVDAISHAAADGESQLEILAQNEPGMNLKALELPVGEEAARKAIAKTKEHDLLLSSGDTFAFNLLVTQTDALSYGSHLARVVADALPRGDAARQFQSLADTFDLLLKQVTAQLRSLPKP